MMKNQFALLLRFGLIGALAFSLLAAPRPASAAPIITGVQPGTVNNAFATTVVVTGSGFDPNSMVVLDGFGALSTTYLSGTTPVLNAVVPAGLAPGAYTLRVVNPDNTTATAPLAILGPTATPAPTAFARPLLVVQSYGASSTTIVSNQDYDFEMTFINSGQTTANNIVVTFKGGDFTARGTGGVRALGSLGAGQTARFFQPLTSGSVSGQLATLEVQVSYTDSTGAAFSETFTLTFDVYQFTGPYATATPTPTATPKVVLRPQLVITGYRTSATPLQPGTRFTLELDVQNVGSAAAKRVTLIAGGGTASGSGDGTPGAPGGVSGGGGDFTNFAPVESSNVQFLGDVSSAEPRTVQQTFIVNATTNAGAYPMKFSFVYADEKGVAYTDDQAITLLVYRLPQVDISFYQPVGPFFTFQPGPLPIQIINLGRNSVILGSLKVSAPNAPGAQLSNNSVLVGNLDIGFPFTLDALVVPDTAEMLELVVSVDYTDDFNQLQTITKTLTVEVIETPPFVEPTPDPNNPGGFPPIEQPETFWDMVVRFLKGLFGLDSGKPQPQPTFPIDGGLPMPTEMPVIVVPPKG